MRRDAKSKILCALVAGFLFAGLGCAAKAGKGLRDENIVRKAPGHLFELGEIKGKDMDTPPYLPSKIRVETINLLKERGLLAAGGTSEKRLSVNITMEAFYAGYGDTWAKKESYSYLESYVKVLDPEKGDLVAESVIRAYGAWGSVTSDFIETSHARDIVGFLETVVR